MRCFVGALIGFVGIAAKRAALGHFPLAMRISEGAALNATSVQDQLDWFKAQGFVADSVTMDMLVDTSFVETE